MLKNFRNKLLTVAAGGDGSSEASVADSDGAAAAPPVDDSPVSGFICPQCRKDFPDPEALQLHFVAHLEEAAAEEERIAQAAAAASSAAAAAPSPSDSKRGSIFKSRASKAATSTFYPGEAAEEFVCPMCDQKFTMPDQLQDHFDVAHVALDFEQETKELRSESVNLVEGIRQQDQVVKDLIQENKELKVSLDEEKWYVEELKKELEKYEAAGGVARFLPEEDQKQRQSTPPPHQQPPHQPGPDVEDRGETRNGEALEKEKNKLLQQQLDANVQQMEQLRGSKELMERKAAELASSVAECRAKVDEAESMKAAIQEEMRQLLAKLETAENQLERRRSEEDDASTLKQELVSIQSIMDEQLRALNEKVAESEEKLEEKLKEAEADKEEASRKAVDELEAEKAAWKEQLTASKVKIEELELKIKDQRNEILKRAEEEAISKNNEVEMAAVQTYKEELVVVSKEAEERKAESEKLKQSSVELSEKLKAAEVELSEKLKAAEVELAEKLKAAEAKETRLKEDLEISVKSAEDLTERLEEMTKANEEMGEKYLTALEENSEKEAGILAQLHAVREEMRTKEEEKTRLENKVEDKRRNEQLINKKLAEMEIAKQEQSEKICQLEEKQKGHESQVAEWSSREIAMETALLQKEGVQRDLQKQVEVLTIRHTEAQSQASSLEAQHQEMQSRVSNFELGMESLENELSSTKAAFEETKRKEAEMRLEFQRVVDEKAKLEVALVDAEKAREEELETLREAKHVLIADKIQLGNKVESLEADLEAKREDLKTMLAETSEERNRSLSEIKRLKEDATKTEENWKKEEDSLKVDLSVKDTKLSLLLENVSTLEQELQKMDRAKDEAWSEKLEMEARVSILEDEKRLLGEKYISSEAKIDEQKSRIKGLVGQVESLQCAAEELARENQMLQVKQSNIQSRKWTDDSDIANCSSCDKQFSITVRKHHCRNCGGVFCAECTENTANVPSFRKPQRVCEICSNELKNA